MRVWWEDQLTCSFMLHVSFVESSGVPERSFAYREQGWFYALMFRAMSLSLMEFAHGKN